MRSPISSHELGTTDIEIANELLEWLEYLWAWNGRASELFAKVRSKLRAASVGVCAHEEALQFASTVGVGFCVPNGRAQSANDLMEHWPLIREYFATGTIPNLWEFTSRIQNESARAIEREREKLPATVAPRDGWFDSPPPPNSAFQFGTISGTLNEIVDAINQGVAKTVRKRNGRGWYVMEVTDDEYEVWFSSQRRFDAAFGRLTESQKKPKRNEKARNGTNSSQHQKPQ